MEKRQFQIIIIAINQMHQVFVYVRRLCQNDMHLNSIKFARQTAINHGNEFKSKYLNENKRIIFQKAKPILIQSV